MTTRAEETGNHHHDHQRSLTLLDASCRLPLVLLLSYAAGNVLKKKHSFVVRWCRIQQLPQITSYMFVGMLSSASVRGVVRLCSSSSRRSVLISIVVVRFFLSERDDDASTTRNADEKRIPLLSFFLSFDNDDDDDDDASYYYYDDDDVLK